MEEYGLLCAFIAERPLHLGEKPANLHIFDVLSDGEIVKFPACDFVFLFVNTLIDLFSVG